jgi:hypothetical protein
LPASLLDEQLELVDTPAVVWSQPVMRSQRHNLFAICLIFEADRSPSGAAAGGCSWDGKSDGEDTCGVL